MHVEHWDGVCWCRRAPQVPWQLVWPNSTSVFCWLVCWQRMQPCCTKVGLSTRGRNAGHMMHCMMAVLLEALLVAA
jgi:hypothetical protein